VSFPIHAATVLVPVGKQPISEPVTVTTFGGLVVSTVSQVKPAPGLTVVWLANTLDTAARDKAKADLLALYSRPTGRTLRLVILHDGTVDVLAPFATRARFQHALDDLDQTPPTMQPVGTPVQPEPSADSKPPSVDTNPTVQGPAWFDALGENAAQLGLDWSAALLIGQLPKLDAPAMAYAQALLVRRFTAAQVRVFLLSPTTDDNAWAPVFQSTGGAIAHALVELTPALDVGTQKFASVTWTPAEPPAGFVLASAVLADSQGQTILTTPDLAESGADLPRVTVFAESQRQLAEAATIEAAPKPDANLPRVHELLAAAVQVNPVDPALLRLETLYCEQTDSFTEASKAAVLLAQVRPDEAASFTLLGHALLLASTFDQAKTSLDRASTLHAPPSELAEDYAHVYLGLHQEQAALPYLATVLQSDPHRQDLWFLQANAAEHIENTGLAIHSLEKGIELGGVHLPESAHLIRLYLSRGETANAHTFAQHSIATLPPDVNIRSSFAQTLDDAKLTVDSLAAWKSVLAVRPDVDHAQVRVAQLLLQAGDAPASEAAAANGLQLLPKSPGLYLVEADAIAHQGFQYRAHGVLQQGATVSDSPDLLAQAAVVQDVYGDGAAEAYARLAAALQKDPPQQLQALQRGFTVALRDNDLAQATALATQLAAAGHSEAKTILGEERASDTTVMVPGGLDALAYVARAKPTPADSFLAEYARAIVTNTCVQNCPDKGYSERLDRYFQTVAELESLGQRNGGSVEISLSIADNDSRRKADQVLHLLGLEIKNTKGKITLSRGQGSDQVKRQEIVSALGFDEIGMQEAFQAAKPCRLVIHDESASVYPNAKVWIESFDTSAGFARTLLRSPQLARLYLAVSTVDRHTFSALITTTDLKTLSTGEYAETLNVFGTSFALQGTHAAVPGGPSAEPLWAHLVGADPAQPGPFFTALLLPRNSKRLTFFFALSQLDPSHQAFFTASVSRADRFFDLFSNQPDAPAGHGFVFDTSFTELLRSVPLDQQGHVEFPGSPEVWTVAKGTSSDDKQVAKLMKQVSKTATPDVEDAILLRLASTRYKDKNSQNSELVNFLAVSRIDAHRSEPLDDESALLLAQRYAQFPPMYAYFADIPGIGSNGFRSFFSAIDHIRTREPLERNLEYGQLYSLVEWVALLNRLHTIPDASAAKLFSLICDSIGAANDSVAFTTSSLNAVRAILSACAPKAAGSADDSLRGCFLGIHDPEVDPRAKDYRLVLASQKPPSLDALFSMQTSAEAILKGQASIASPVAAIAKAAVALPSISLPKQEKLPEREKNAILLYEPEDIEKVAADLSQAAAKQKQNPKTAQKLATDLLADMEPQVSLALAAPLYAYFLRSTDLVVAEDPLLLRKHRYVDFVASTSQNVPLADSQFVQSSEGLGSYFLGGFAQFGLASGKAAAAGWKQGGAGGNAVVAAQIAALRTTAWDRLNESDQRLVSLRILTAREWIVRSAQSLSDFQALRDATAGILSLARRADLLNGIEDRDWKQVWASITLPDLFELGGRYLSRYPSDPVSSPVTAELRLVAAANDGRRLDILGRIPYQVMGCSHPHLVPDAPYEEYERRMFPEDMAERSAEFKLFLVYRANNFGAEPADLAVVAEPLAAKAFRESKMTDYHDWRSLLAGYASITNDDLRKAMQQ